jgi:cobalt-zinc-cadmium efflux system outer membrane protein
MRIIILSILVCVFSPARPQDTLSFSLQQTDSLFLSNNLLLLAAKYKVDGNKALVQQSKLWDNPTLSTEWNLYNPQKDQFFDVGPTGQKIVGIDQVISIAGKRNKRVALAKANAQFTEYEFYELMRTLKTEVHNNYFAIYFSSLTIKKYNGQLTMLGEIIDALQLQSTKGNIPLKEVMRLKALYYQLNNERSDLISEYLNAQQELATLLHITQPISSVPLPTELDRYNINTLDQKQLVTKAITNRPDLKMVESLRDQAQLNYVLQKRNGYPDLHIGALYDQAGSYVNNYSAITLGMDLPVWNRNQGNRKYAQAVSNQYKAELENKNIAVSNEVLSAYQKLMLIEQEYKKVDVDFSNNFELLNEGFISNFQKRNISMIEFTDFVEAYNNSIQQLNKLKEKRIQAYEELNYVIGEELFH